MVIAPLIRKGRTRVSGRMIVMFPIIGDRRITRLDCGRGALMLDNPEKTARLLAALKAAVPFKVELVPSLVTYLRAQHVAIADQTQHIVSNLSYAGDEGGIVCHIAPPDKEEAGWGGRTRTQKCRRKLSL